MHFVLKPHSRVSIQQRQACQRLNFVTGLPLLAAAVVAVAVAAVVVVERLVVAVSFVAARSGPSSSTLLHSEQSFAALAFHPAVLPLFPAAASLVSPVLHELC